MEGQSWEKPCIARGVQDDAKTLYDDWRNDRPRTDCAFCINDPLPRHSVCVIPPVPLRPIGGGRESLEEPAYLTRALGWEAQYDGQLSILLLETQRVEEGGRPTPSD